MLSTSIPQAAAITVFGPGRRAGRGVLCDLKGLGDRPCAVRSQRGPADGSTTWKPKATPSAHGVEDPGA